MAFRNSTLWKAPQCRHSMFMDQDHAVPALSQRKAVARWAEAVGMRVTLMSHDKLFMSQIKCFGPVFNPCCPPTKLIWCCYPDICVPITLGLCPGVLPFWPRCQDIVVPVLSAFGPRIKPFPLSHQRFHALKSNTFRPVFTVLHSPPSDSLKI
jgi:hypothetical protein